ncbi:hypothetical protein LY474_25275 [Myxococcus stipitatus]|uniref:hypothetical protein n=1 Tax=Myxococcus stipitatus TaxID=83455 RepID=UPI001F3799E7|nr:hypothetical protein [Myxococcus stipitatus]MCE9671127.1 hypothetical protein [Myxococcus stipitatus]
MLLALLLGCGANTGLPSPRITSVSPGEAAQGYTGFVRVTIEAVLPVRVDYGRQEANAETAVRVLFGSEEAPILGVTPDGSFEVRIPEALALGDHDVRVVLADGREARREDGFTLVPVNAPDPTHDAGTLIDDGGTPDGGTSQPEPGTPMREGDITAYEFDAIADQAQGQAFVVTVRAIGPRAWEFEEKVELALGDASGAVSPQALDQFVAGVCTQSVTVSAQGNSVKLVVKDRFGVQATSNAFKVR